MYHDKNNKIIKKKEKFFNTDKGQHTADLVVRIWKLFPQYQEQTRMFTPDTSFRYCSGSSNQSN